MIQDPNAEPPIIYVRCLRCNELVEADEFEVHAVEDCDGIGWEPI